MSSCSLLVACLHTLRCCLMQFDIIVTYLWYFHREEYSWHMRDAASAQHPALPKRHTEDPSILALNSPVVGLMKHLATVPTPWQFFYLNDYLCVGSDWHAGNCLQRKRQDVEASVHNGLGSDWQFKHAAEIERGFPAAGIPGPQTETVWSTPAQPWKYYAAVVQAVSAAVVG